ncbi:MAG TPA: aspartate/glutamate racemase family protein [Pseudoneobacillus sp.]|nr:aspartate/glutamate racemase family protein [Pseudoneobacillus sp.]
MKTIGLIGGMSWESTVSYYRLINEGIKQELGGLHSAKCILYSVDFAEIESYQATNQWEQAGELLTTAAKSLEKAGADFIMICTNTMHKVIPQILPNIHIPILHIADATATKINENGIKRVGLLGTKYTMEQNFYTSRIEQQGIEILLPDSNDRETVNKIIYEELCLGIMKEESKKSYQAIIRNLIQMGAEAIILGCTEIGLLIKQEDYSIPIMDTTIIHAEEGVKIALK